MKSLEIPLFCIAVILVIVAGAARINARSSLEIARGLKSDLERQTAVLVATTERLNTTTRDFQHVLWNDAHPRPGLNLRLAIVSNGATFSVDGFKPWEELRTPPLCLERLIGEMATDLDARVEDGQ